MGLLVPIEYPRRIDIATAVRMARGLGRTHVHVDGYEPVGTQIDRLLALLVPDTDTTVRVEHGVLPLEELEPVALAPGGSAYTDVRGADANVRLWSERGWVHVWPAPLGGIVESARVASEIFGVTVPAVAGRHSLGDLVVTLATSVLSADVESLDRAAAWRYFCRVVGPRDSIYGTFMSPTRTHLEHLPRFLHATRGDVEVGCSIPVETAAELAGELPCERWAIDMLEFHPTDGLVQTYLVAPVKDAHVEAWIASVDAALSLG